MGKKQKEIGFVVEKIVDKRITADGKIEYFIKWRGYPSTENTWEPEENCECPALIQKFEESRAKTKKRSDTKPKFEEIQKPRGYERELEIDQIVGATDITGEVQYLIKWQYCDEYDLVAATEVRAKNPEAIIEFYERRSPLQRVISERLVGVPDSVRIESMISNSNTNHNETSSVSYSIPVPGVGTVAIDVPLLEPNV